MSIESPYQHQLNTCRLILLLEERPFTNVYNQVELTLERFKALSDTLWNMLPKTSDDRFMNIPLVDRPIKLPDDVANYKGEI